MINKTHTFHIPVMGIGFTLDSPLKVAHLGIDSVISLVDDILIEKMRKFYSEKYLIPYKEISDKIEDFRAKRITSYLNLLNDLVESKFDELKNITHQKSIELQQYFNLLPGGSSLKKDFDELFSKNFPKKDIQKWLDKHLKIGSIDVNIMTKIDKENYFNGEKLPAEFNDAHAALRGFAESKLSSSVILSAGMNPRLYSYLEQFSDFYPDQNGYIKKKVVLKVSDYRSALIQGKFLAKKGIWVSEYRIESGLNCGGHAFATQGFLLGPILQEFKDNRIELKQSVQEILFQTLSSKNKVVPEVNLELKISAQGGVGTHEEQAFLTKHYQVDSVGWGSPFLLVPEATTVDEETLQRLEKATESDLYLSNISPLGVPFNNLRGNTKDAEKNAKIEANRPGSTCPKQYVALNKELTKDPICTASRQYQRLKIKELEKQNLNETDFSEQFNRIVEKSCICVGLGTSALMTYDIDHKTEGTGVSVCPGPNMAYFSKKMSLSEITDHIYGRAQLIKNNYRPNFLLKELNLYVDYFNNMVKESIQNISEKQTKVLNTFGENLNSGISYYQKMFGEMSEYFSDSNQKIQKELEKSKTELDQIYQDLEFMISNLQLKKDQQTITLPS
ncbi:hypothetical protein [Namhaeicola litoreus]|uniref:Uncharacterized protein n=1 Tax=Namhaeicola litoreus TaxID=1052145 RepID=A0ABW3Y258_9FLAO